MRFLRVSVPLALIAFCIVLADGRGVLDRLAGASWEWLLVTAALLNLVTVLSAVRWRLTARALDLELPLGEAVREYYLAQFVNQTLPGGILGDAARAVRSRRGGPMMRAAQAVVLERAAGQVGMAAVFGLGLAAAWGEPQLATEDLSRLVWMPLAVLGAIAAGLGVLALARTAARGWAGAVRAALIRPLAAQAVLSLVVAALTVIAFATAARATGTALSATSAALVVPLILTAMLLPASVAGWGWREGAAAALFPLAGAGGAAGLAASIAFGVAALAAALPGAFVVLRRSRGAVT